MLRTFIQVLGLTAVLLSSFFLIRGILLSPEKVLAELSIPVVGYSLPLAKNLCQQRADAVVGFVLLLFSFFLQMANLFWEMQACDFATNKVGAIVAIIVSVVLWFISIRASDFLYRSSYSKVEAILKAE